MHDKGLADGINSFLRLYLLFLPSRFHPSSLASPSSRTHVRAGLFALVVPKTLGVLVPRHSAGQRSTFLGPTLNIPRRSSPDILPFQSSRHAQTIRSKSHGRKYVKSNVAAQALG